MLTFIFTLNKAFCFSTLATNLLAIVVRLFDYDCNIFNLVIGLSIDVLVDVAGGIDHNHVVSSNVRLGVKLRK
jgi:hypothetical protein